MAILTNEEIRIKALELATRIRVAALEKVNHVPLDNASRVVKDAQEFENYIKNVKR